MNAGPDAFWRVYNEWSGSGMPDKLILSELDQFRGRLEHAGASGSAKLARDAYDAHVKFLLRGGGPRDYPRDAPPQWWRDLVRGIK